MSLSAGNVAAMSSSMSSSVGKEPPPCSPGDIAFEANEGKDLRKLAPAMPPRILAYIHEEFSQFDPEAGKMLDWMKQMRVFHEFAHCRDPFHVHLRNTWSMLSCWEQPQDVCRFGLFHSAYSRDGFLFRLLNLHDAEARHTLRDVIGEEAEQLVYNYCSPELPFCIEEWLSDESAQLANGNGTERFPVRLGREMDKPFYDIPSRADPEKMIRLSAKDVAKYLVVFVADVAEQMSMTMTYRDIYHEAHPSKVWPGSGVPALGFSFFSRALFSARSHLDVVPPVFNHCTAILKPEDEVTALKCYWSGVQQQQWDEPDWTEWNAQHAEALFREATEKNPWVAEPHVMLAQLLFMRQQFSDAVHHAACALEIFYQWGTCWDKRHPFAQWVGFTRMTLLRAKRCEMGQKVLPSMMLNPSSRPGLEVTYLQDLVKHFEEFTEKQVSSSTTSRISSRL